MTSVGEDRSSLGLEVLHQPLHVAKLHFQLQLLLGQRFQLPPEVVDVALKHVVYVAPGCLLLLQEVPFGLQNLVLLLQVPYLHEEAERSTSHIRPGLKVWREASTVFSPHPLPKQWGLRNPISAELGGEKGIHGCKRIASSYVEAIFAKQMGLIDLDCILQSIKAAKL